MNNTIWKFPLFGIDRQEVELPKGARPLSVGVQNANIQMWAAVDSRSAGDLDTWVVWIHGTGYETHYPESAIFLGTVPMPMPVGELIFHVFAVKQE